MPSRDDLLAVDHGRIRVFPESTRDMTFTTAYTFRDWLPVSLTVRFFGQGQRFDSLFPRTTTAIAGWHEAGARVREAVDVLRHGVPERW